MRSNASFFTKAAGLWSHLPVIPPTVPRRLLTPSDLQPRSRKMPSGPGRRKRAQMEELTSVESLRHDDPWDCQFGLPPQTDPPGTTPMVRQYGSPMERLGFVEEVASPPH